MEGPLSESLSELFVIFDPSSEVTFNTIDNKANALTGVFEDLKEDVDLITIALDEGAIPAQKADEYLNGLFYRRIWVGRKEEAANN